MVAVAARLPKAIHWHRSLPALTALRLSAPAQRHDASAAAGVHAVEVYAPPARSPEEIEALAREVHMAAALVMPYVCSSLMQIAEAASAI